jgi:hypothetical protein
VGDTACENKDIRSGLYAHKELLNTFLEIAERKVSILDDHGDENWDALPKEIERLLLKTAKLDQDNSAASCGGKSVFVRQLRGPHLSTWP